MQANGRGCQIHVTLQKMPRPKTNAVSFGTHFLLDANFFLISEICRQPMRSQEKGRRKSLK